MFHTYSIWDSSKFTQIHRFDRGDERDPTENLMVRFGFGFGFSDNTYVFAMDPTTNHSFSMCSASSTVSDFVVRPHDIADTSGFTYNTGYRLPAEFKQTTVAKAFAICLCLTNWTLTVGSVYITALVVSRMLDANIMVAAVPFSALLIVPVVRSLYIDPTPSAGTSIGQSCIPSPLALRFVA